MTHSRDEGNSDETRDKESISEKFQWGKHLLPTQEVIDAHINRKPSRSIFSLRLMGSAGLPKPQTEDMKNSYNTPKKD